MPTRRPASVLLVGHPRSARLELCRMLEHAGFSSREAKDGSQALEKVREHYDLLLVDVHLQDMTGFELCRRIRSEPGSGQPVVVFTSAFPASPEEMEECFQSGADDYIARPVAEGELAAILWGRIHARRAELQRANRFLGQHADASESKLARLRAALGIAQLGIWECAAQLGIWQDHPVFSRMQFDERCCELLGLSESLVSLGQLLSLVHDEDRDRIKQQLGGAMSPYGARLFDAECRIARTDGRELCIAMRADGLRPDDPGSRHVRLVGTMMDITERKRTQQILVRSEKVAALGRMAATLAHEINNPLAAAVNTVFLARNSPDCPASVRQYLDITDEQLRYISHITRQALGFYRENSVPARVDVTSVVTEALQLFKGKAKDKHISVEPGREGMDVLAVSGEIRQVFSNLIANSLEAVQEGGTIRVRLSMVGAVRDGNEYVRITVADNGKGIPRSAMPHLFEPLFTTKGSIGTGLGLWVSRQIVEKYGGWMRLRSCTTEPRRGTTFSIFLPSARSRPPQPEQVNDISRRIAV